jgi:hypothetical protein
VTNDFQWYAAAWQLQTVACMIGDDAATTSSGKRLHLVMLAVASIGVTTCVGLHIALRAGSAMDSPSLILLMLGLAAFIPGMFVASPDWRVWRRAASAPETWAVLMVLAAYVIASVVVLRGRPAMVALPILAAVYGVIALLNWHSSRDDAPAAVIITGADVRELPARRFPRGQHGELSFATREPGAVSRLLADGLSRIGLHVRLVGDGRIRFTTSLWMLFGELPFGASVGQGELSIDTRAGQVTVGYKLDLLRLLVVTLLVMAPATIALVVWPSWREGLAGILAVQACFAAYKYVSSRQAIQRFIVDTVPR